MTKNEPISLNTITRSRLAQHRVPSAAVGKPPIFSDVEIIITNARIRILLHAINMLSSAPLLHIVPHSFADTMMAGSIVLLILSLVCKTTVGTTIHGGIIFVNDI